MLGHAPQSSLRSFEACHKGDGNVSGNFQQCFISSGSTQGKCPNKGRNLLGVLPTVKSDVFIGLMERGKIGKKQASNRNKEAHKAF
jgi:hypothetical protein